jgi:hypothetical protein
MPTTFQNNSPPLGFAQENAHRPDFDCHIQSPNPFPANVRYSLVWPVFYTSEAVDRFLNAERNRAGRCLVPP